jgi:TPR repeat protein
MSASTWLPPDASGRIVLKPSLGRIGPLILLGTLLCVCSAFLARTSLEPAVRIKAAIMFIGGATVALAMLYRYLSGAYDLTIDDDGFTLGARRYGWGDTGPGFVIAVVGRGSRILRFGAPGTTRSIGNLYAIPLDDLAALLNARRQAALGGNTFVQPAAPRAKTPALVLWLVAAGLAAAVIANRGNFVNGIMFLANPLAYAAKSMDDETLSNQAGKHDRSLLPVLLARANGGDKSAMYFYGDLYDPEDFLCETAVPKNAATAVYWYQKAVALDDEGAERNLGILYRMGVGVPQDDAKAAALFEMSVTRHNDDIGDFELGQMLESGQGERQDLPRAVRLEQASAAQGQALGETELGYMYLMGIGVAQNDSLAKQYLDQANAQGNSEARMLLMEHGLQ